MGLLITGLALFVLAHLWLSLGAQQVAGLRARRGENSVKGIVTLLSLAGIALMVLGWRRSETVFLYSIPPALRSVALVLTAAGIYLVVVSTRPSRLRRVIRHPQLTGVFLWAVAHLLLNGDSRSAVLFGGLGLWSALEILLINRRDGAYTAPPAPSVASDVITTAIAVVVFVALIWAHPWLAGVPVLR